MDAAHVRKLNILYGNDVHRLEIKWSLTIFSLSSRAEAASASNKMSIASRAGESHNVTGHFLLPGLIDTPFVYRVRRTRDGGIYCLRQVDVFQHNNPPKRRGRRSKQQDSDENNVPSEESAATPCFTTTVSFKRLEEYGTLPTPDLPPRPSPPLEYVPFRHVTHSSDHLIRNFPPLSQPPESHDYAPSADFSWYIAAAKNGGIEDMASICPGVEMRKPDLESWHQEKRAFAGMTPGPGAYRLLHLYRIIDDDGVGERSDLLGLEGNEYWDQVNLHACAHLYASDRNGLFLIARALGFGGGAFRVTSLSHSVVFHAPPEEFLMTRGEGEQRRWFVQEAWSSVSGGNRGMHESRLWRWDEESKQGALIAGTWQDGMVRLANKHFLDMGDGSDGEETPDINERDKPKL
ncbi:MAG: hypothetical protein Q9227_008185 [Pyrenula ochraceoflavens]